MEEYIGKICPFCKTEIKEGDAVQVCPACGIPHHAECWEENKGCTTFGCSEQHYEEQHTNPTDVCGLCGTPLGDGQMFCPNCGTAKGTAKSEDTAPKANVCAKCGAAIQEGQAFCPQCGAPQGKKNVCGKCGAELQEGQVFCPKCGQKVGLAVDAGVHAAINQFNAGVQKKGKKKAVLPIILGIIAVIVVAAFLFLRGFSVKEIVLSKSSVELKAGDSTSVSYTISPSKASDTKVTWKSSNTSVATVSSSGKITGKGDGTCTITVSAGGKSDSLMVTVKTGPDFKALYQKYCNSTWADYGADGSYLSIDTNPYDWDDDGLAYVEAYYAIEAVNNALGLPSSLLNDMGETTGADGKQTETFGDITVTWKYHPDRGLEVTYKAR